jgi:hypothetical protein
MRVRMKWLLVIWPVCGGWFEQIPLVAVKVFEDGDGAVGFDARRFQEADSVGGHGGVVALEIDGVKKKKDATAGLVADASGLFGSGCVSE